MVPFICFQLFAVRWCFEWKTRLALKILFHHRPLLQNWKAQRWRWRMCEPAPVACVCFWLSSLNGDISHALSSHWSSRVSPFSLNCFKLEKQFHQFDMCKRHQFGIFITRVIQVKQPLTMYYCVRWQWACLNINVKLRTTNTVTGWLQGFNRRRGWQDDGGKETNKKKTFKTFYFQLLPRLKMTSHYICSGAADVNEPNSWVKTK